MPKKGKGKGKKQKAPEEKGLSVEEFKDILRKTFKEHEVIDAAQKFFLRYIENELETREKETDPLKFFICDPAVTSKSVVAFSKALCHAHTLKFNLVNVICFFNCELNEAAAEALSKCVSSVSTINRLEIRHGFLNPSCCQHLGKALEKNARTFKSLKLLNLSHNNLKVAGLEALTKSYDLNQGLEKLFLENCALQKESGKYLSKIITNSPNLQVFSVNSNNLQAQGLRSVCEALQNSNSKLEILNFGLNKIGEATDDKETTRESLYDLCSVMQNLTTLHTVELQGNSFSEEFGELLKTTYEQSKVVKLTIPHNWTNTALYKDFAKLAEKKGKKKKKGKGKKKK